MGKWEKVGDFCNSVNNKNCSHFPWKIDEIYPFSCTHRHLFLFQWLHSLNSYVYQFQLQPELPPSVLSKAQRRRQRSGWDRSAVNIHLGRKEGPAKATRAPWAVLHMHLRFLKWQELTNTTRIFVCVCVFVFAFLQHIISLVPFKPHYQLTLWLFWSKS